MDTSAIGDPKGLISGINVIELPCDKNASELLKKCAEAEGIHVETGIIASGDRFIAQDSEKSFIRDTFSAIACEMEGAAVGQVCYVNHVPCCVMRAISDGGDEDAKMDYPTFAKMAAERAVKVMLGFLAEK
jgi:adenosylhomocysteine nucleosidase